MFRFFMLLSGCLWLVAPVIGAGNQGITQIKIVEKLCHQQSGELLEEQGITLIKWTSQRFNGDRTFNVEGNWLTNGGEYIVECELPYGSDESVLTIELTKIK